ncbi:MAG: ABC transporter permease subunit [Lachnospiraceae bacterium]|nr:ABC transporter permease subunit [Lachnospiraceae bacterium]
MKNFITQNKYKRIRQLLIVAFWLIVWQLIGKGIPKLLFAGPLEVLKCLLKLVVQADTWRTAGNSIFRVAVGFFAAFICGNVLAVASHKFKFLRELLSPIVQLVKTIPVASFIIVALIWISSKNVSILISFVVFPISYVNMLEGLANVDVRMLEMAEVFRIRPFDKFRAIYFQQLLPFIISGCKVSVGMAWKAGVAGEIIGRPDYSVGDMLYAAKLYLATDELFAWTVIIILLGVAFEKCILMLLKLIEKKTVGCS